MRLTDYRVLLSQGYWVVKRGGIDDGEVVGRRALKMDAVARGRALALVDRPSRLFIYREDGAVDFEWTYTTDPGPPAS